MTAPLFSVPAARARPLRKRWPAWALLLAAAVPAAFPRPQEDETEEILRRIYEEVRVMSPRPGELFNRQEFFIGDDDDDTNKDISVSVIIRDDGTPPVMILQFTWMEREKRDRRVSTARSSKSLRCILDENAVRREGGSFGAAEIRELARGLIKAVRDKKRLLGKSPFRVFSEHRPALDFFGKKVLNAGKLPSGRGKRHSGTRWGANEGYGINIHP